MKKLLLSLIFLSTFASIKTADNSTINEKLEETEFTEKNNQLILQAVFGEKPLEDKAFFDLSIKEIWNTKLKPVLQSKKFLVLLVSTLTIIQDLDIIQKILSTDNYLTRLSLREIFSTNALVLLLLPNLLLTSFILGDIIDHGL